MATQPLTDLWPTLMDIFEEIWPARRKVHAANRPPFQMFIDEYGLQPPDFGEFEYVLQNYDPYHLSVEHYMTRNCYGNPAVHAAWFERVAAAGLLETANGTEYTLTNRGEKCYFDMQTQLHGPRWALPTLSDEEVNRLIELLAKVVQATINAPEPPDHWAVTIRFCHGINPPDDTSPRERIFRHIFDLWAYRDDVHLAAWRPHLVPARTWEALTVLWRGEANSAETLADVLNEHGFSATDYVDSIAQLIARSWVEPNEDGTVSVTAEGRRIRDEAEQLTDAYFYAPWACLSDEELSELRSLLAAELEGLKRLAAA